MDSLALRVALGRAIRQRRARLGKSQEAFADVVGVHRTYMGSIERGERNVSLDNLVRIARGLGLRLSALVAAGERRAAR